MAQATLVYRCAAGRGLQPVNRSVAKNYRQLGAFAGKLFARGAGVPRHVFSEGLNDSVCEGHFVVYAVVGDCLL